MPRPPRMMLGFVVRRCSAALGRQPTPAEFAAWANNQEREGRRFHLFGRPISEEEARVILRHPSRLVTARDALAGAERLGREALPVAAPAGNVVFLDNVRRRRK